MPTTAPARSERSTRSLTGVRETMPMSTKPITMTAAQFLGRGFDPFDRTEDVFHQLIDILRASVGNVPFGERPHSFVGVEFRGVRRKIFDREERVLVHEVLEWLPLM